jgi:hypothetical protein
VKATAHIGRANQLDDLFVEPQFVPAKTLPHITIQIDRDLFHDYILQFGSLFSTAEKSSFIPHHRGTQKKEK